MKDPLFFWRLNDELSVVNAAILIVGGDPSQMTQRFDHIAEGYFEDQDLDHDGFAAAFTALKAAIRNGTLPAKHWYGAQSGWSEVTRGALSNDGFIIVTSHTLNSILEAQLMETGNWVPSGSVLFHREPDWWQTNVKVEDLKRWLRDKGIQPSFFFPETLADRGDTVDEVLDFEHEHFTPELALALTVWRALLPERAFKGGVKSTIEAWIKANPDAWHGEGELSVAAKERIITLVNWNKSGGAPKSSAS